jgi:hypothetical protein
MVVKLTTKDEHCAGDLEEWLKMSVRVLLEVNVRTRTVYFEGFLHKNAEFLMHHWAL